jgi:hypothetical protein
MDSYRKGRRHEKARTLGSSRQAVQNVFIGKSYKSVLPEIPRPAKWAVPGSSSCYRCLYWVKSVSVDGEQKRNVNLTFQSFSKKALLLRGIAMFSS